MEMQAEMKGVLASQYGAALTMLRSAIEACPDRLWNSDSYANRFWHIAYHALFYAHLYLSRSEEAFVPWREGRPEVHYLGALPGPPHARPKIGEPYPRGALLEYQDLVMGSVSGQVSSIPLDEPSGFQWLPMSRLELHIYNIRHIQHHTGQLIDRIRAAAGKGVDWVDSRRQGE